MFDNALKQLVLGRFRHIFREALGAWLLVRVPRRQPFIAITVIAVVVTLFGLGGWAFQDMYTYPFGPQFAVVPGPGDTVKLKPGPGFMTGSARRVAPASPSRAVRIGPSGVPSARPAP